MEMREAEIYPASLLNQIFTLNLGFLEKLHALEEAQVQLLREQMAEHQRLIDSINRSGVAMAEPEVKAVDVEPVLEPETRPEPKPEEPVIPKVEEPAPVVVAEPELKPVERQEPPVVQQAPEAHKPVESAATSRSVSTTGSVSSVTCSRAMRRRSMLPYKRSTVSVHTRRPSPILTSMRDGIRTIRRRPISSSSSRNDFYKPTLI